MDVVLFDRIAKPNIPFGPLSIDGLYAWYAARLETGYNDGDDVTTFVDQSGNGRDLTQASASRKPHYRITTRNIGGVAALEYVPAAFSFHAGAWDPALEAPFTMFVVLHPDRTQTFETIMDNDASINTFRLLRQDATNNQIQFTDTGISSSNGQYTATDMLLSAVIKTGANSLRKNGTEVGSSASTISETQDGLMIGGRPDLFSSTMFDGLISEVIFYDKELPGGEINQIENFLIETYGLS